jgi:hypothetical protein
MSRETNEPSGADDADRSLALAAVEQGTKDYFAGVRARVKPFVDAHFSLKGTLRLHRAALGWDIARAPLNLSLALPNVLMQLGSRLAGTRAPRLATVLDRKLLLETDVARELAWLIHSELLRLPFRQGSRESEQDALSEAILATPMIESRVQEALQAIGRHSGDPAFRARLADAIGAYGVTRAAASEITTGLMSLGGGALTLHKLTPGAITLGPALAGTLAQQAAIGAFPLGSGIGGVWYGFFPAAPAAGLVAAATGGLVLASTLFAAFAGVVSDPIQRAAGLHERRLMRMADALERQFLDPHAAGFAVHDHYVARLLDVFDILGAAVRIAQ